MGARQGESQQSCLALALHHHSEKRHLNILGTICERDLKQLKKELLLLTLIHFFPFIL